MTQLGTFSEYMVVAEESVIKIDDSIPFEAASLVSCGVTTGWGSATVGVGTQPGDTVVIVGTGGVGINAVQGARAAGANAVVAVDPVEFKRDTAKFFGATDTSPSIEEAFLLVQEITNGVMADRVVLTPSVLHAELLAPAMMLTRKGGTCLMTAVPKLEVNMVPLLLVDMLQGCKQLKGLLYGGMNPRASMPMLLSMYRSGNLKLDELVTPSLPARSDQRRDHRHARRPKHPRHHRIRLGAGVSRRVGGVDPQVDAEFGSGNTVVDRQVGDAGLEQHVLAQQGIAGVFAGRLVEDRVGGVGVDSGLAGPAHRLVAAEQVLHRGGGHQGARPQRVGGDALVAQLLGNAKAHNDIPYLAIMYAVGLSHSGSSRTGGDSVRMCGFCRPTMCGMHACDTAYVPRTWIPFIRSKRLSGTSVTEPRLIAEALLTQMSMPPN